MKVVLLDDVKNVGKRHEVKDVSPGFARNFLIGKKLAVPATDTALKQVAQQEEKTKAEQEMKEKLLTEALESLKDVTITISAKTNEEGHLFAGIGTKDISEAILSQKNISIPEDAITLEEPLKEIGEHIIPLLVNEKKGSVTLSITKEK